MFSLRCDYRENRGGCVISTLNELRARGAVVPADKYELRDEVMTTGDYAIQFAGYVILIERKTWEDLSASIKDKRIERNHEKMLAARDLGYRIAYLIEGKAPHPDLAATKVSGISYGNMQAKLDHFAVHDGVMIEYTRNSMHTAQRLLEMGKNLLTLGNRRHEVKEVIIGGDAPVPGSIMRTIDNPDEIIKKKYERTIPETRAAMLACVPGIGPKTAAAILAKHAMADVLTLKDTPAGLTSFQSTELAAFAAGDRPTIVVSMLQEIKGVSKAMAQKIAAGYSVQQLCTRDLTMEIANIKINEAGRRLGDSLAGRIVDSWFTKPILVPKTTSTTEPNSDNKSDVSSNEPVPHS